MAPPDCAITSDSSGGSQVKWALPTPSRRPATGSTDTGSISDLPVFCSSANAAFSRVMTVTSSGTSARTSAAVAHSSAAWASARHSSSRSVRICALTAGIAGTLTLSSSTPRPTSSGTACGSPAMPPQTPVQRPCAARGAHRLLDQPEHGGRQPVHLRREPGMTAIHRQRVLGEVVGADREEVHLPGELVGQQRRRRDLDHDAGLDAGRAEPLPLLFEHGARRPPLVERRDHREHDRDAAVAGRAEDRAQLRAQQLRTVQQHADAALAEKRVVLARKRQVRQRLVAADVERADDQRPPAPERARDVAVDGQLLLLGRRRRPLKEQELRSQQADGLRTERDALLGVGQPADVRGHLDAVAVERRRRFVGPLLIGPALARLLCLELMDAGDVAVDGFRRSVPLVPSRITGVPFAQVERPRVDPGHQRNLERAREDRHVRRGAARRRAQPEHLRAIQRRRVGGRELLGDQDRVRLVGDRRGPRRRSASAARAGRRRAGRSRARRAARSSDPPAGPHGA